MLRWASTVSLPMAASVVTVEDVFYGLAARPQPAIAAWFERFFESRCELLPITTEIARQAGRMRGRFRAEGQQRTQADMLIAATAQAHQLPLATRNGRDFEGCGIPVVDPFAT